MSLFHSRRVSSLPRTKLCGLEGSMEINHPRATGKTVPLLSLLSKIFYIQLAAQLSTSMNL